MKIGAKKISLFAACFFQQNPLLAIQQAAQYGNEGEKIWVEKQANKQDTR
jgi:hypothetical protein